MNRLYWLVAVLVIYSSPCIAQTRESDSVIAASAQINSPPSEAKLVLIRQFMKVAGIQRRLDSGSFLQSYALNDELGWHQPDEQVTLEEIVTGPNETLLAVYDKYRPVYQAEYEQHINWEFTEDELMQMIAFFASAVGQHYLDGIWRMEAYTGTNLEETEEALVAEAVQAYRSR